MTRSLPGSLLLLSSLASSQVGAADVGLALQGGAHTSWASVAGPAAFATDSETRLAVGIAVPVRLSERVSLEPGLLYADTAFSSPDFGVRAVISARTLLLPLPLKLHWNAASRWSPHLAAGPSLAFVGRVRQELGPLSQDLSDDVRDLDVGILVGAGLTLRAGRGRVTLDLRYLAGLRDLDESETSVKIRSLQALVGYGF